MRIALLLLLAGCSTQLADPIAPFLSGRIGPIAHDDQPVSTIVHERHPDEAAPSLYVIQTDALPNRMVMLTGETIDRRPGTREVYGKLMCCSTGAMHFEEEGSAVLTVETNTDGVNVRIDAQCPGLDGGVDVVVGGFALGE